MTDNEIKKALECCIDGYCRGCMYGDTDQFHCKDDLMQNALDLINRQKAEIDILIRKKETLRDEICKLQAENEKLKTELVGMRGAANSYKMHYDNAQAEIKELQRRIVFWREDLNYQPEKERAEAIKEFAERLQVYVGSMMGHMHSEYVVRIQNKIDNLVKEMVGE